MLTGLGALSRRTRIPFMPDHYSNLSDRRSAYVRTAIAAAALTCALPANAANAQALANRIVSNCTLNATQIAALTPSLVAAGIPAPTIDFVVVYSLTNPNDGQALGSGGTGPFTGPVLCTSGAVGLEGPPNVNVTTPIPASGSGTVDLLGIETALITQYRTRPAVPPGKVEKRFCHSVGDANDCFRIFALPASPG